MLFAEAGKNSYVNDLERTFNNKYNFPLIRRYNCVQLRSVFVGTIICLRNSTLLS